MKRIGYYSLALLAATTLVFGATTAHALAPNPNNVHFTLHYMAPWETTIQCPVSIVTGTSNYPFSVAIQDSFLPCTGWMNNSFWRFSDDGGSTDALVHNDDNFRFSTDMVIDGNSAQGAEAFINIAPWWYPMDGRINVKGGFGGGEIAAFGGRMPFVTWTNPAAAQNYWGSSLSYVKGTTIHLGMEYISGPTGPSDLYPGRVKFYLTYGGTDYNTGYLLLDQGNPAEDPPHGLWGILNPAYAGGGIGVISDGPNFDTYMKGTWSNITFENLQSTPTHSTTWGAMKALYR